MLSKLGTDNLAAIYIKKDNLLQLYAINFGLSVTSPVDPYFHVPYLYWEIIGAVIGAMIFLLCSS